MVRAEPRTKEVAYPHPKGTIRFGLAWRRGGLYRGTHLLIQATRPGYEDVSLEARLTGALQVVRLNMVPK